LIVADQKPIDEIIASLEGFKRIVIASCGTCVTVCMSGGEKEALAIKGVLESHAYEQDSGLLRDARNDENSARNDENSASNDDSPVTARSVSDEAVHYDEEFSVNVVNLKRQCDDEFVDDLEDELLDGDVILSMACGVGVQFLSDKYKDKIVLPGLNTQFYGAAKELGYWTEYCGGCGDCLLEKTGGVCPIARCSKSILNGPCGGSQNGKCEIDSEIDCAWQLIFDKLSCLGRLDKLLEIYEPRDWRTSRDGGPRSLRKEDVSL
jgi:ferredoxin